MKKIFFFSVLFVLGMYLPLMAQYTETINANRPGASQGAFSVGRGVIQLEAGAYLGKDKHSITEVETKTFGGEYDLRYGFLWENLEVSLRGDVLYAQQEYPVGGSMASRKFANFRANTIGAKVLVFDIYKRHMFDKPNLYSWKANNSFKWWTLIPAISVYAGYNFTPSDRPEGYPLYGQQTEDSSPVVALITQHNWGGTALIMNFIGDRLTDDHKRYSAIVTLTQALGMRTTIFAEYQAIKDDFYADDLLRFGGTYLFTPDFQIDLFGMTGFKNTPSRWQLGAGVAYRFDFHSKDEKLTDPADKVKDAKIDKQKAEETEETD